MMSLANLQDRDGHILGINLWDKSKHCNQQRFVRTRSEADHVQVREYVRTTPGFRELIFRSALSPKQIRLAAGLDY